ncbi:hypothetical protein Hypma_010862 [Hypsizygus marmoreus]|uniref:Protein kinase domain-containing protein n=1 Tax=Hypsizygus marmoreus TaxID=39966 RepID=A0A369JMT1_HYPMA|nr:hypothetical protein Hypma_010862 [Hypsizygus marmoreus]
METAGDTKPKDLRLHSEQFWVGKYEFLKSRGYQLRPRYHPEWKPPWYDNEFGRGEETIWVFMPNVMDAIRIKDGKKVFLKAIDINEGLFLRRLGLRIGDNKNHTVRVHDLIPFTETRSFAVMQFLRVFDDPPFRRLSEPLEAIRQFLEGLEFIHGRNIAHRDMCHRNLMMDASELIPGGFHFAQPWMEDGLEPIKSISRSSLTMKYYIIDFELSVFVKPGDPNPKASGIVGQDRTVPEFTSDEAMYNPYKLDIYQLGNMIVTRLIERYDGLDCLIPLAEAMTSKTPSDRPTASEAVAMFDTILKCADGRRYINLRTAGQMDKGAVALRNIFLPILS